jgi:hypothetical protein
MVATVCSGHRLERSTCVSAVMSIYTCMHLHMLRIVVQHISNLLQHDALILSSVDRAYQTSQHIVYW